MKRSLYFFVALSATIFSVSIFSASCSQLQHKPESSPSDQVARLNTIIQEYADAEKHIDAYSAPYFNVEENLSHFGDYPSPDFFARSKQLFVKALDQLKTIDASLLPEKDQRSYSLFKEDMTIDLRSFDFPEEYLQVTQMGNRLHEFMDSSSDALTIFPFDSVKHYEDYLKRAQEFPNYVDRQITEMREGIRKNIVLSCTVAPKVPNTYKDALNKNIKKNPFYRPVLFMPKPFSAAEHARLDADFQKVIREQVLPGYQKFDHFYRTEYMPHCRKGFGLASLPDGERWYRFAIRNSTNLELDPKDIHQIGLNEVARISLELEKIKNQVGFKGTLRAFMKSKSRDPKSYFTSSADMFKAFEKIKAEVAKKIPNYFSLIPKSDFKIVETSNPEDAAGSYNDPTESAPYGRFVVNTKNLHSVAIYGVTTLMMHETVPGHHFQLALQYEMKDQLSEYQRKMFGSNAFAEGWALYSEYLGNEMGMYQDPMQRFGNLNDEMLRAVRLVVDTGIHSLGWSQKKAIHYAMEHLASDAKGIEVEINRYSVWPGQALGYKIGQLKILELRKKAEQTLGNKFDIKAFHKAVIGNGSVSLGVLESQVNAWIQQTKNSY